MEIIARPNGKATSLYLIIVAQSKRRFARSPGRSERDPSRHSPRRSELFTCGGPARQSTLHAGRRLPILPDARRGDEPGRRNARRRRLEPLLQSLFCQSSKDAARENRGAYFWAIVLPRERAVFAALLEAARTGGSAGESLCGRAMRARYQAVVFGRRRRWIAAPHFVLPCRRKRWRRKPA